MHTRRLPFFLWCTQNHHPHPSPTLGCQSTHSANWQGGTHRVMHAGSVLGALLVGQWTRSTSTYVTFISILMSANCCSVSLYPMGFVDPIYRHGDRGTDQAKNTGHGGHAWIDHRAEDGSETGIYLSTRYNKAKNTPGAYRTLLKRKISLRGRPLIVMPRDTAPYFNQPATTCMVTIASDDILSSRRRVTTSMELSTAYP